MLINVIWSIVNGVMAPGWNSAWAIVVALALLLLMLFVRVYPIKAQDRIILLEEKLRYPTPVVCRTGPKGGRANAGTDHRRAVRRR